jgi:hypothetical protein
MLQPSINSQNPPTFSLSAFIKPASLILSIRQIGGTSEHDRPSWSLPRTMTATIIAGQNQPPLPHVIDPGTAQTQALAGGGVDLEDGDMPPRLDAFKIESRNDPVASEAEREVWVFVERRHHAFLLARIIAIFSRRVSALIAASRFNAELWLGRASW